MQSTKNLNTTSVKSHYVYACILAVLTVISLNSCGTKDGQQQQQQQQQQQSIVNDSGTNLNDTSKYLVILSGPNNHSQTSSATSMFNILYTTGDGLNLSPLEIEFSQELISHFTRNQNDSDNGLVFHYGLDPNNQDLVYMVSPGCLHENPITNQKEIYFKPFPQDLTTNNDYYLVLEDSKPIRKAYQPEFSTLKANYVAQIKRAAEDITNNHPTMVYHEGKELKKFYDEYQNDCNLHMHIIPGAALTNHTNSPFHLPIFAFGNGSHMLQLNNTKYPSASYRYKALDAGQLCPPLCGTQNYTCP